MTILPAHTQRDVRNLATASLSILAYQFKCEVPDILALLSQPSQAPRAPAASTPAVAPAVVKAEEVSQAASSATEPQPPSTPAAQAHIVEPGSNPLVERPTSLLGADGAADPAIEMGKSVGEQSPAAPAKKITQRQRVLDCHQANPDWGVPQIAAELEMSKSNVWSIASQVGLKFTGKKAATTEALKKSLSTATPPRPPKQAPSAKPKARSVMQRVRDIHAEHPSWGARQIGATMPDANPQTVSVSLSDIRGEERAAEDIATQTRLIAEARARERAPHKATEPGQTLTDRVRALHLQRPNWTARMIANELGAPPNSVRTLLSTIRGEAKPRETGQLEFAGKAALQQHYGDVAKRLGKPS